MAAGIRVREKEGAAKKPTRFYSSRQEKTVAKAVGGRQTANSGATMFGGKSDVSIGSLFSLECKTKTSLSESMSIKKEWLEKLAREAVSDGHPYSALAFNFGPDQENYYIIDEYLFQDLVEYLKGKER